MLTRNIQFSPDSQILTALGSFDGRPVMYSWSLDELDNPSSHHFDRRIEGFTFTPDSQSIIIYSRERVEIWDVDTETNN